MKALTYTCFALFLVGVFIFLGQLWFHIWSEAIFIKLLITDGVFFVVGCVGLYLVKESKETEKINGGGLD